MAYDQNLDADTSWRVLRAKFWREGQSLSEIDSLSLEDLGDILGYMSEKGRAEEKSRRVQGRLKKLSKN